MREIKFRAWDKNNKKMFLEPFGIRDVYNAIICDGFKRFEIMQFTGLKDKNGKEIFEGDILRVEYSLERGRGGFKEENMVVKFDSYKWFCGFFPFKIFNGNQVDKVEVIGNKFENPELLEVVKR